MIIEKNAKYKIKGKSEYFLKKYNTSNPEIIIEDLQRKVFEGTTPHELLGNPANMLYVLRATQEDLPLTGDIYYGKIKGLGEIVHESELIEV